MVFDPIVTTFFSVRLDSIDLGMWTQVDLGGIEVTVEERLEGGDNLTVHKLPGRLKYQNIKTMRVMGPDTPKIGKWFRSIAGKMVRSNGEIVAYDRSGKPALRWDFIDALPVRWTLPSLSTGESKPAIETLEIAHQGFVG